MILDRSEQVVATRGYRQLRRVGDLRNRRASSLYPGSRSGKLLLEARAALVVVLTKPVSLAAKAVLVPQCQLAKRRLVDEWHLRGAA